MQIIALINQKGGVDKTIHVIKSFYVNWRDFLILFLKSQFIFQRYWEAVYKKGLDELKYLKRKTNFLKIYIEGKRKIIRII